MAKPEAVRVVIDTNVCLALFVFQDPSCEALAIALERQWVMAFVNDETQAEWERVLARSSFKLDERCRQRAQLARLRRFDRNFCDFRSAAERKALIWHA